MCYSVNVVAVVFTTLRVVLYCNPKGFAIQYNIGNQRPYNTTRFVNTTSQPASRADSVSVLYCQLQYCTTCNTT